jgi:voltage-gated potassium channel Kch
MSMNTTEHNAGPSSNEPKPEGTFRQRAYAALLDPHIEDNMHKSIEKWIGILIVANLCALVFEHVQAIYTPYQNWFHYFDVISVIIFTAEYLLRLYLAPEDHEFKHSKSPHLKYISSPFAIIDFLAVAPFYLQAFIPFDLRVLRSLRLLRILKLFRVLIPAWKEFQLANRGRTFRQKIHALVYPSDYGGELHHLFDNFIVMWVVLSVVAVVLESVHSIHYVLNIEFIILDAIAVSVFTIEYCLRIYSSVESPGMSHPIWGRLKQAKTPQTVIDLLAILPFFLEVFLHHLLDLRFLRVFRLLRLLKLTRYTGSTKTLFTVVVREWPVLAGSAFIMLLLVILTASLGYLFEHDAQPEKFENIPQSIYWAVITLASVGYGDISPVTPMGRMMTIILALLGIGIFAIPAAILSSAFSDQLRIERDNLKGALNDMLGDGVLSEEEQETLNREAKRLHLSKDEVNQMIEQARKAYEKEHDTHGMPVHKIAANTELAVEHFKHQISELRQLALLTNLSEFDQIAVGKDRLNAHELEMWKRLQS